TANPCSICPEPDISLVILNDLTNRFYTTTRFIERYILEHIATPPENIHSATKITNPDVMVPIFQYIQGVISADRTRPCTPHVLKLLFFPVEDIQAATVSWD